MWLRVTPRNSGSWSAIDPCLDGVLDQAWNAWWGLGKRRIYWHRTIEFRDVTTKPEKSTNGVGDRARRAPEECQFSQRQDDEAGLSHEVGGIWNGLMIADWWSFMGQGYVLRWRLHLGSSVGGAGQWLMSVMVWTSRSWDITPLTSFIAQVLFPWKSNDLFYSP